MGAWIEIKPRKPKVEKPKSRTPRWVRGLKFILMMMNITESKSHPTMGAWIEICFNAPISDT